MNVDMIINKKDDGKMLLIEGILRKVNFVVYLLYWWFYRPWISVNSECFSQLKSSYTNLLFYAIE